MTVAALALRFAWAETRALTFEQDVRPILKARCTHCHGEEEKPKGGVDLRLRRFMDRTLEGGNRVVVPGRPDESEMVLLIREEEMPKKGRKLAPEELQIIEKWIAQGAKNARPEPESLAPGMHVTEEDRQFWSFKPVARPSVPAMKNNPRVRTPIDAFILAKLRNEKLEFAPDADRRALVRRVTLDLTGLIPTPEEVDAFMADTAPDAYEKVVDRLLSSSAYGERWARHWLDVAGYADSNGVMEVDSPRKHAWRYRDYVIRAFNTDKPWSDFIVEQLAGDELAGVTQADARQAIHDPAKRELLVATGFLRLAPDGSDDGAPDPKLARNQVIADEMKIVSSSLLGLTVACAQCHDHRYDPISHADYYKFRAIFDPALDWQKWRPPSQRLYSLYTPEDQAKADALEEKARAIDAEAKELSKKLLDEVFEQQVVKLPEEEREPYRLARATADKQRTPEQKALLRKYPSALALRSLDLYDKAAQKKVTDIQEEATKIRAKKPAEAMVMALTEVKGAVPESHIFNRGDHDQPKERVKPGELTVLASPEVAVLEGEPLPSGSTGRRLAYARWLTSGKHPLVARVLVNRIWLHHFGRGIVNTPGDFGFLGESPTHPELLDWLATQFVEGGWKLKSLHRLMLTSTAYRQSSRHEASLAADPENKLHARFMLQRLDAEALRDSVLAATGRLNRTAFGEPIEVTRDPVGRIVVGRGMPSKTRDATEVISLGEDDFRRSIYVSVRRKQPLTVLDAFDAPALLPNCEVRNHTTVTPQSLLMMNDTFILDTARAFAERLRKEVQGDARAQIKLAWQTLFSKEPAAEDISRSLVYLAEQTEAIRAKLNATKRPKNSPPPDAALDAFASLCQVLLGSNRFLYVE